MKSAFFVLCLALFSTLLSGQSFFTVGANYTVHGRRDISLRTQNLENFKLTPSIGYGYNFKINEKWSYQTGIYLGDLGSISSPDWPKVIIYVYAASLNQFLDYRPLPWLSLAISPSVYYVAYRSITRHIIRIELLPNGESITHWRRVSDDVNRVVFSIVPRVSFHLNEKWSIDLFYRNDLTPVSYTVLEGYGSFNRIGYGLGINMKYQLQPKGRLDE